MDISGKRIAFTGRLRDLRGYGAPVSRTDAALLVEGLGAKALRAVSPRADLIVAGLNARPDPVKAKGIPVLDEKIFGRFLGATPVVDPGEFADPAAIAEADPDKLRAILEAADWDAFTPERDLPGLRERLRAIEADQGVTEAHLLATAKLTEGGYRAVAKLCHPHQHRGPVRSAALSPDGRWLAIGSAAGPGRWTEDLAIGGAIEVFEVAEGRVVNVIGRRYGAGAATGLDAEGRRDALRWSADTRRIAAVYDTDRFGVWEAGALDYPEADADITTGRDGWPAFALSPDGRHAWIDAATGGAAPGVIVNVETGRVAWDPTDTAAHRPYATEFTTFPPGPDTVVAHRVRRCHGWSPDGSRLAFIGVGAAFAVDLADGSIAWSLDHDGEAAAFSPCGRFVACAHGDGTVLADARTGEVLSRIDAAARDLVWSPGGARLALLGGDAVHIVETGDGSVRGLPIVAVVRDAVMPDVTGFAFAPGEPRAAVRTTEGVEVWSLDGEPARSAGLPAFAGTTGVLWGDGDTIVHIGPGGVAFTRSDGTVIGAFAFAIPPGPSPVDVVGGSTGARMGYEQCFALDEETWAVSFPEGRTVLVPPGRESDVDERLTWSAGSRHAWPLRWGRPTVVTDIPAAHANLVAERSVEAWAFERIVSGD